MRIMVEGPFLRFFPPCLARAWHVPGTNSARNLGEGFYLIPGAETLVSQR